MPNDVDREKPAGDAAVLGTPYGPHPNGVDEAAGGADSSPFENESAGEQRDVAADERGHGRSGQSDPADARRGDPRG